MKIRFVCVFILLMLLFNTQVIAKKAMDIGWDTLSLLNVETGERPKSLSDFEGETVEVTGFIVPLEMDDYIDKIKDFLLVPDPFSCYHVPPPPLNQIVLVNMKKAIKLDMDARGVAIKGVLTIEKHPENQAMFSYKLKGISAKEANIEFPDFFEPEPLDSFQ